MPGKRKRDEETQDADEGGAQAQIHGATVFVSNLPYNATNTDLKTLFSDIAPIKNAFVVLEKETKVSKGVGYVTFAMKEDAAACVEKEKVEMNGRSLRVSWAGAKPKPGEASPVRTPKSPKQVHGAPKPKSQEKDLEAMRTVILSGLPDEITSKVLWKKVRKQEGAESLVYPFIQAGGTEDARQAEVRFTSSAQAQRAIDHLNAHIFKGSLLGATLKKRLEKKPNRASRLIIRNLPWDTTEAELRALFVPYGSVYSVEIPTEPSKGENRKPKAKGFAFVWMLTKSDAETAIEKVNGQKGKDRPIAVDWSLSKSKWENEKEKMENAVEEQEEEESEKDSGSGSEDGETGDENEGEDEEMGSGGLGVHSDQDVSMHSADEEDEEDAEEEDDRGVPTKPELPPPEAGTTLFIRNVPWEATEDELRQALRGFGPLRYVRIVMDHEVGRSKGTAFACYWKKEDADKVIANSEALSKETSSGISLKNPFSAPSLLTPDPTSSLAKTLVLHGRTLDVVRAVTRETATTLKDAGVKMREKADKRNMYLMREGVIFPNSPAASTIPPAELEKRINSFNQRRALLRTNPSLFVSKTRLSIRQIPTFISERSLKRLALHALRQFDKEVEEGDREGLNADELDDHAPIVDSLMGGEVKLPEREAKDAKGAKKRRGAPGRVKQAKIIRVADRVDAVTGKGKSKGYGFLELERHSDALKVLRWANNNPDVNPVFQEWWREELNDMVSGLEKKPEKTDDDKSRVRRIKDLLSTMEEKEDKVSKRTLVVEFSIENTLVVKKREERGTFNPANSRPPREGDKGHERKSGSRQKGAKMDTDSDQSRPSKRTKKEQTEEDHGSLVDRISDKPKPSNPLGSIIGRKRKMKKVNRRGA